MYIRCSKCEDDTLHVPIKNLYNPYILILSLLTIAMFISTESPFKEKCAYGVCNGCNSMNKIDD